ncbi:MAG: VTT domain-containing protein [Acidobacteria bacterium]|nr:VTT domain-containing protein [Acidobacteriota bacterium]
MPLEYWIRMSLLGDTPWLFRMGQQVADFFSGYGGAAVLLLAIADSSFLSVPEGNDLLIVMLSAGGSWGNMAYFVCMTVAGSLIGCLLLYSVGRKGGRAILNKKFSPRKIERAEYIYGKYGILAVLIPSVLPPPLPFKIFVLSAGVFGLAPSRFLTAVAIGRTIRYSMWGILAVLYGDSVKMFLQENIKTVWTALSAILLLIIISTVIFQLRKKKRTRDNVRARVKI